MYQALYRKYRPQTFDEVVGQSVVTTTLKNQVMAGRLSHAYLFTGTHGTGKTTCAKILAKAVNCENPVDGNPCNCCPACRGIDSGSILDVQEMDAASNSRVDNIRQILDEVVYLPASVRKRVYIIDEVHMLSTSAFNALLKTIEEPPEYLVFILATTELNKIPATILSRCQRFAFRRPTAEEITSRINYVAYQEGLELMPEAAELLGRLANGAFRDGLSLLDQCASAANGILSTEEIYRTLGLAGQQKTAELMQAIAQRNIPLALSIYSGLYSEGKDAAAMLDELGTLARDMLILKTAPGAGLSMISSTCTMQEIRTLEPMFTAEELLRLLNLLQTTTAGFRNSVNQRLDCELCLIQLCSPESSCNPDDLSARISRLEEDMIARILGIEQRLQSGDIVVSTVSEHTLSAPEPIEEKSKNITEAEPEPRIEAAESDELWQKMLPRVLEDLPPSIRIHVQNFVTGSFQGDVLMLMPANTFVQGILDKNSDVLREVVSKKAAVVLGKSVQVRIGKPGKAVANDLFATLAQDINRLNGSD